MKKTTNTLLFVFIILNIAYFLFTRTKKEEQILDKVMSSNIIDIKDNTYIPNRYFLQENWKDSISLSIIVRNGPVLILRMPRVSCEECKFVELENLKMLFSQYSIKSVCAVITTGSPRELKMLTQSFSYNFLKVGSLQNELIDISAEKQKRPYYFVLDSNLRASKFFFPDMRNQKMTVAYFERIIKMFFQK